MAVASDKKLTKEQELRDHCERRLIGLRSDRMSWWSHWRELADYLLPRRYEWLITPNRGNRGSQINHRILNSTGTRALRILASGMMAGITSPGRPWFKLTLDDSAMADDEEVKSWLDEVAKRMMRVFGESNFYNSLAVMYQDLGCFGTSPMIIYEDYDDVIRCYTAAAGEYFLASSDRNQTDALYREFTMTTYQMVQRFGLNNCTESVKSAVREGGANLVQERIIGHAIEANPEWMPGANGFKNMQFREVYWEYGSGSGSRPLLVRGFHECPFISPRWDVLSNDPYGRSPGMDALGDVKQLQLMTKRESQALDKHVNPPMLADISLKNEPASLLPGGITYVAQIANGIGFKPVYEIEPDFSGLSQKIEKVEQRISDTFYTDLFMMISQLDTVRTATEIDARKEEKLIQLGPVLERFENEALDPAVERTFAIMHRAGLLPQIPQQLAGKNIKVEYVSMLAQSQKAAQTAGIERLASFVGGIAAAHPDSLDMVDWDETITEYSDLLGNAPNLIADPEKVAAVRQARQQQAQAQQSVQNGMAAAQGAQTLSQTDVGGGINALQMMLGQQGGSQ